MSEILSGHDEVANPERGSLAETIANKVAAGEEVIDSEMTNEARQIADELILEDDTTC